jgi:peptide/nickel transport system permease protein
LTYGDLAYLSRYQRGSILEVLRSDFIRTARAKGLTESSVMFKHALRNALIPVITIVASILPAMIGGSVIIESIFSIPGIGQLGFEAVLSRDYPVIMAIATISAFLTLVGILLSDLAYVIVDPRISFERRR